MKPELQNNTTDQDPPGHPPAIYTTYLGIGSNIQPADNIRQAVERLREVVEIEQASSLWETPPFGGSGPNFLNAVIRITTPLPIQNLKDDVLCRIEEELGRVRTADKNAPRTIDLDVLIYDGDVLEPELWTRVFIAVPLAELLPELRHPAEAISLRDTAQKLQQETPIRLRGKLAF